MEVINWLAGFLVRIVLGVLLIIAYSVLLVVLNALAALGWIATGSGITVKAFYPDWYKS